MVSPSSLSLSLSIRRRRFAGSEESSVHIDQSFNLGIESAPGSSAEFGFRVSSSLPSLAVDGYFRRRRLFSSISPLFFLRLETISAAVTNRFNS
ncbi:hypothetical protein HID58_085007 [Brassica napus]|uniref:Uncharacterized protein n=1 Tax=Brassica napus TaxID=3708 RepID=A0ABQ7XLI6_BRANA|nr:hypothetical protein HID58_085007 [Brassica napus]